MFIGLGIVARLGFCFYMGERVPIREQFPVDFVLKWKKTQYRKDWRVFFSSMRGSLGGSVFATYGK